MTFRILSLDGGGSWAVLQVMALAAMYGDGTSGHTVLRDFDLVAANSGGSLTLGGLVEDRTLGDLRDNFFRNEAARKRIFVARDGGFFGNPLQVVGIGPKYVATRKLTGLQALLVRTGGTRLSALRSIVGGSLPDLLICAFNYDLLRGEIFRSNRESLAKSHATAIDPTLAEALHASTDAPINYFDAPAQLPEATPSAQYWDGGIAGYNNPVLLAVMEALANGHARRDIRVLSLGTGTSCLPFDPDGRWGELGIGRRRLPRGNAVQDLLADVSTLAASIVDDPPDIATYHAHIALDGTLPASEAQMPAESPVVRMNPMISPVPDGAGGWRSPDGISDFGALDKLDMDAVEQAQVDRIVEFGTAWLGNHVTNQPVRINRTTLGCEIGHPSFERALAVWRGFGPCKSGIV